MTDEQGRVIELSIEVPGSPEEVWEAIATGPGISSWFVPTEVEEHVGGAVRQDFGELGSEVGAVVAWEPPERVVFGAAGRPLTFEWTVEAVGGGSCTVRLVNTGFGHGEEWDDDYDGMSMGWRLFLEILRLHLTHFRSEAAVAAVPAAMVPGPNAQAWEQLCGAFDLAASLDPGATVSLQASDGPPWSGRVERATATEAMRHYVLLFDEPRGTGFLAAEGKGDEVAVSAYAYLYGSDAAERADSWRRTWAERAVRR